MANELRLAPAGASDAECAVCLHKTYNRIVLGDGHVPICSGFCLQAWPRVQALLLESHAWRTLVAQARAVPDGLVKCADVLASNELVEGRIVVIATKGGE